MASTSANRVLYRSPDAPQNLRVKASSTRVSGPRADHAAELEAKRARERGEAQQRAAESTRHAATMGARGWVSSPTPAAPSPRARVCTRRPEALSRGAGKGFGATLGTIAKGGGNEALDVDDDAENDAPGNGSARGGTDQTEEVVSCDALFLSSHIAVSIRRAARERNARVNGTRLS